MQSSNVQGIPSIHTMYVSIVKGANEKRYVEQMRVNILW